MRISKEFFFQSLIWQKSPPQFVNGRDSKIGIGEESFIVKKKGKLRQIYFDWSLLAWGSWRWTNAEWGVLCN